jgi:hypothetical protein
VWENIKMQISGMSVQLTLRNLVTHLESQRGTVLSLTQHTKKESTYEGVFLRI